MWFTASMNAEGMRPNNAARPRTATSLFPLRRAATMLPRPMSSMPLAMLRPMSTCVRQPDSTLAVHHESMTCQSV